ncbi:MAG: DUF3426 domain-containing protein [Pseudomonadota bacterium]
MIIQCSQCSAKFRFDDALMREEGVWVRCGLCQYEFFQCHPFASPVALQVGAPDVEEIHIDREADVPDVQPEEGVDAEPVIKDDVGEMENVEAPKKSSSPGRLRILAYALALLFILAGAGFLAFPELAQQAVVEWSAYLPWLEKEPPPRPSIGDGIRIEAIRQRFIANMFAGKLRVVEGVAVNESGHPLGRLQMKATLVDAQNNWLGEKRAYAGHVLSDAELTALNEEEMNRRLAVPEGSTTPNDRIMAGGRIPFMIVWASEPPGAEKTFVAVTAVERLPQ